MAPPLSTLSPSQSPHTLLPSRPFLTRLTSSPALPSSPSLQCQASISDQLRPLSLTLLKEPSPADSSSASSKPTWVNPTRPKPDIISLNRHRRTKPGPNRTLSESVTPALVQTLNSIPHSDGNGKGKAAFFAAVSEAFTDSVPTRDDVLFLLKSLSCYNCVLLIEWLKETCFEMETIFYNLVLKSLRAAGHWDEVDRIAREMLDEGPQPDNITYSTVITAAHKCRKFDKAIEWFDVMYGAGVIPDEITFSAVLKVYAALGKKEEAFVLYERGRAAGWKPDHVAFAVLGKLFGDAGDQEGMMFVRDEMKRLNIVPNVVVYNTLINGFGRAGRVSIAKELFEEMCQLGVSPDVRTLTAILKIYGKHKRTSDAMDVWVRMKENSWPVDQIVYNTLLTMCKDLGTDSEAERIFGDMKRSPKWRPDKWTYSVMIKLYCRRGKIDHAWQLLFEEMPQRNIQSDVTSYTSLIDCLGKQGRIDDVVVVFDAAMETVPSEIDDRLCCCLLSTIAYCKDEKQFNAILGCIEKANPTLHKLIHMLRDELVGLDEMKKSFRELLSTTPLDVRQPYCNCLIEICTDRFGFPSNRPNDLFHLGYVCGLYQNLETRGRSEWSVDLRRLSLGAAKAALADWFNGIAEAVEDRETLPPRFRVFTGFGSDRFRSVLTKYFEGHLSESGSPFHKCLEKAGSFVADNADLVQWLQSQNSLLAN